MARANVQPTIDSIATRLVDLVPNDVRADLQSEDPVSAVELYYSPLRLRSLPAASLASGECSTDGFYDAEIDPRNPWIFYAADVSAPRVRFTVLHELGHHLLVNDGAHLLDDLDVIAGSSAGAALAEESVCHRFAGKILVPDELITATLGDETLRPRHVEQLRTASLASWEAVAVRLAASRTEPVAVVLIREPGQISFSAASTRLGWAWWPRGSPVDADGPLARAHRLAQTAIPDTYRHELAYARRMFCDTLPVRDNLAIAVLTDRPSDRHFEILEEPEPIWKTKEEFCEWCGAERDTDWCDSCSGRLCRDCGRCGCTKPIKNPLCPRCGFQNPFRAGAAMCRDCEADY